MTSLTSEVIYKGELDSLRDEKPTFGSQLAQTILYIALERQVNIQCEGRFCVYMSGNMLQ